jgi:hypothetical protein
MRVDALSTTVSALQQRCTELEQQRTHAVMAPVTLFDLSLSWSTVQTTLPPRCSHASLALTVGDQQVMLILGGIANSQWHPSALVVTGLDGTGACTSSADSGTSLLQQSVQVHVASSSDSQALARREIAACALSGAGVLVSGGVADDEEALSVWTGHLTTEFGAH